MVNDQKIIHNFNIDTSSLAAEGGRREFFVKGDPGAVFSIIVSNEDPKYYNFEDTTSVLDKFQTTKTKLTEIAIPESGVYKRYIDFPVVTDDDEYIIELWAEPHYNTVHTPLVEGPSFEGVSDPILSFGSNSF